MQVKSWLDQQVAEKHQIKQMNSTVDQLYDKQLLEVNREWDETNKEYEKRRRDMRECTKDFQSQQRLEKEKRDALDSLIGDQLSKQHVNYCLNNDFYTENVDTCTSSIVPHRVLKYHWKGMNADQLNKIRLEQERQIEDKKLREKADKDEEAMWAAQEEQNRRNLLKVQREFDRAKKGRVLDEMVEYNKLKAKECQQREKILYDNVHNYKVY